MPFFFPPCGRRRDFALRRRGGACADGRVVAQIDGETGWTEVAAAVAGAGVHELLWRYVKDSWESGGDLEAAALAKAANGRPVWQCYVADLDPEDADDDLVVTITMKPDGTPDVRILRGEKATRRYETQGAPTPAGPWGAVGEGTESSRFYRVRVLPVEGN